MEIQMSSGVEEMMKRMLLKSGEDIVERLSEKYGFSYEEGVREVNIELKIEGEKRVRQNKVTESKSKMVLPFCGSKCLYNCEAIRLNHGLYSQCTNSGTEETNGYSMCKTCIKQTEKNSNGKPTYGYISDRVDLGKDFRDPKGKEPVLYGNIMEKLNISREDAIKEAEKQGLKIPEEQFEVKKAKRGRPKKEVVTADTSDSETEEAKEAKDAKEAKEHRGRPKKEIVTADTSGRETEEPKASRGRPKKNTKPTNTNIGDDIIKGLVESKGQSPLQTPATVKSISNSGVSSNVKEATVSPTEDVNEDLNEDLNEDSLSSDNSDDEELAVCEFKIGKTKYLKAADNTLYSFETHEEIGHWNPETKTIE